MGYAEDYKGYRCYDASRKCVKISRNVVFDEMNFDNQLANASIHVADSSPV